MRHQKNYRVSKTQVKTGKLLRSFHKQFSYRHLNGPKGICLAVIRHCAWTGLTNPESCILQGTAVNRSHDFTMNKISPQKAASKYIIKSIALSLIFNGGLIVSAQRSLQNIK